MKLFNLKPLVRLALFAALFFIAIAMAPRAKAGDCPNGKCNPTVTQTPVRVLPSTSREIAYTAPLIASEPRKGPIARMVENARERRANRAVTK
jgi:hypothetical protein